MSERDRNILPNADEGASKKPVYKFEEKFDIHWREGEEFFFYHVPLTDLVNHSESMAKFRNARGRILLIEDDTEVIAAVSPADNHSLKDLDRQNIAPIITMNHDAIQEQGIEGIREAMERDETLLVKNPDGKNLLDIIIRPANNKGAHDVVLDFTEMMAMDEEEDKADGFIVDPETELGFSPRALLDPLGKDTAKDMARARERRLRRERGEEA